MNRIPVRDVNRRVLRFDPRSHGSFVSRMRLVKNAGSGQSGGDWTVQDSEKLGQAVRIDQAGRSRNGDRCGCVCVFLHRWLIGP